MVAVYREKSGFVRRSRRIFTVVLRGSQVQFLMRFGGIGKWTASFVQRSVRLMHCAGPIGEMQTKPGRKRKIGVGFGWGGRQESRRQG